MINLVSVDWKLENIDTVLFDKDGTFIDLHYFWGKMSEMRVEEIIRRYKLPLDLFEKLCLKLGYNVSTGRMLSDGITALYSRQIIIQIFCKDLNSFGVDLSESDLEAIFDCVSDMFYKDMVKYTKPIYAAIDFIKNLREKNIKTGVVTSDSVESTVLTLKHFGWENLFDVVIGRESTKETKESGVPVKLALQKMQSNPLNTIMVGDAPTDYFAAKNAGVDRTILVATGQLDKKSLTATSPYALDSLTDLMFS